MKKNYQNPNMNVIIVATEPLMAVSGDGEVSGVSVSDTNYSGSDESGIFSRRGGWSDED